MKRAWIATAGRWACGRVSRLAVWLPLGGALFAGCGHKPPPEHATAVPEVVVQTLRARTVAITREFPGRITPERLAQVRARVNGIVLKREFEQGTNVQAGQVLYRIDPAPYLAALDSAKASVAQAEASFQQAQLLAERYKPLVGINAVSKQNYDNALAAAAQAKASVAVAEAARETARINLDYCTVTAPINGRIGQALVTEGALVSQSAATEMAVIQQLDPIYFDLTESSAEALSLRQDLEAGRLKGLAPGQTKVTLMLPDGTNYIHAGKLLFADVTVEPTSGMITLRAEFPNPEGWLLPGMFAMARLEEAEKPETVLVPQPAVSIGSDGGASVMLVTPGDQVQAQPVELGSAVASDWIIRSGLKPGDRVIVQGLQKVHPGIKVKPVPAPAAETNSVPQGAGK